MTREAILARLAAIREEAVALDDELRTLSEADELDDTQEARFSELMGETEGTESPFAALRAEKDKLEKRLSVLDASASLTEPGDDRGAPQLKRETETDIDLRTAGRGEVRSAAMKVLEREHKDQMVPVSDRSATHIERLFGAYSVADDGEVILDGSIIAKRMLITESSDYRSAFQKALKGQSAMWSDAEKHAMMRAAEQSLTSASGGYAVPTLIDPTVILTSGAVGAPVVDIARVEPITTNKWVGVTSAGVTFSNVPENTASTAAQVTLAQPEVTAHKVNAFIPFSLEIEGDWARFATEMATLIDQGYVDYLAEKTITGTGTIEMFGIVTAIDATAGSEVTPTTDGQLGAVDALKLWNALPERSRQRSAWLSNVSVESVFRQAEYGGLFTVTLTAEGLGVINGKRYYTTDYFPAFSGTTGKSNLAVLGDFSRYVIAQRVGMSIELIPHVFDSSGLPKGQRGYYAWARVGADSIDDNAFRLLQNQ